jgi:Glyoxalase/Bleomycin resistance protein/Dioxygenase superfamily
MSSAVHTQAIFQVGIVVPDLEPAIEELSKGLATEWTEALARGGEGWPLRVAAARTQLPYLELIEGPSGSAWDGHATGPRLDHVAILVEDFGQALSRLEAAGFLIEVDGRELGRDWTYHRGHHSGLRLEVLPAEAWPRIRDSAGLAGSRALATPTLFQIGLVVDDLDAAATELRHGLGLTMSRPATHHVTDWELRVAHSLEPPHLELMAAGPDTPWHAGGKPRLDHLAYRADGPIEQGRARLRDAGFAVVVDGADHGGTWTLHRGQESGVRLELFPSDFDLNLSRNYVFDG